MQYRFMFAAAATMICSSAFAQTPLSAYVDSNGFINVQTLTCAQLAGTFPGRRRRADHMVQRLVQWPGQKALPRLSQGQSRRA